MTTYVVVPSYNGKNLTHSLFDSLDRAGEPYRLILMEDQGTERIGICKARNRVFQMALRQKDCDYIASLSNDPQEITPNWLKIALDYLKADPKVGAFVGGKIVNYGDGRGWGNFDPAAGANGQWYDEKHPFWDSFELDYPQVGTLFVSPTEAIRKVGFMDENFGMGAYEDIDYALRLWEAGYKVRIVTKVRYRYDIKSMLDYDWDGANRYLERKWGPAGDSYLLMLLRAKMKGGFLPGITSIEAIGP